MIDLAFIDKAVSAGVLIDVVLMRPSVGMTDLAFTDKAVSAGVLIDVVLTDETVYMSDRPCFH